MVRKNLDHNYPNKVLKLPFPLKIIVFKALFLKYLKLLILTDDNFSDPFPHNIGAMFMYYSDSNPTLDALMQLKYTLAVAYVTTVVH